MSSKKSLEERAKKVEIVDVVKPAITDSICVRGGFDECLYALDSRGYDVISLEESAQLFMQRCKNTDGGVGGLVQEAYLVIPSKGQYISKGSFVNSSNILDSWMNKGIHSVSDKEANELLKSSVFIPRSKEGLGHYYITESKMRRNEVFNFCFGESSKEFFRFFNESKCQTSMDIEYMEDNNLNRNALELGLKEIEGPFIAPINILFLAEYNPETPHYWPRVIRPSIRLKVSPVFRWNWNGNDYVPASNDFFVTGVKR